MVRLIDWPLLFGMTLLAELGVRALAWRGRIRARDLLLGNFATHPTLFLSLACLPHPSVLYAGEGLAVLIEAVIYARRSRVPFFMALAFSAFANLTSFVAGLCV